MSEKSVEPKKGGKLKFIILITLLIVIVLGGAFGGFYYYFSSKATQEVAVPDKLAGIVTFSLDEMKTNLNDKKIIQVTPALAYNEEDKKLPEELEKKLTIIRSEIILFLGSKSSDDFSSEKIDVVRNQLVGKINQLLEEGQVEEIYFSDLLIA